MITGEIISVRTVTRNDLCDLDPLKKKLPFLIYGRSAYKETRRLKGYSVLQVTVAVPR